MKKRMQMRDDVNERARKRYGKKKLKIKLIIHRHFIYHYYL